MLEMTWEACERCGVLGPEVHAIPCQTAYTDKKTKRRSRSMSYVLGRV